MITACARSLVKHVANNRQTCTAYHIALTGVALLRISFDTRNKIMAKRDKSADSVYKVVEVIGTSTKSWADAGRNAVETAASSLRDLRVAEVVKLDMTVEKGKVATYRARVALSFKYGS
jgi:flavin-binding protein dodecin